MMHKLASVGLFDLMVYDNIGIPIQIICEYIICIVDCGS